MGYRQAAVLAADCFCLGVLLICFSVDYRVLFTPVTDDVVRDGFQFYKTFYNAPMGIKALLHATMGLGVLGLVGKLNKWDDSAKFFDGSSLVAWVLAIVVYISVSIPMTETIAKPVAGVDTRADQVEALSVLSAGNTIIVVLLGAILVLQAGEVYARRADEAAEKAQKLAAGAEKEMEQDTEKEKAEGAPVAEESAPVVEESAKDK